MQISRVGTFTLGWGESLVWDDRRRRLYFVDCAAGTLHWLEEEQLGRQLPDGEIAPATLGLPSMVTGVVPTTDDGLVVVLDDGLHRCDPDTGRTSLLAPYPPELGGRANDACADLQGNIVTGKLNLGPAEGSAWQFSPTRGWTLLDPDIANTNGPAHLMIDDRSTLIVGDTSAEYYAYDYDGDEATASSRRVFGDTSTLIGHPDGTTVDADNGLWCALVGGGEVARFTNGGLDTTLTIPATNPTDLAFGGTGLDRLFVTSIGGDGELDGALLVVDGLGHTGRPEPRAHLAPS